MASCAEAGTSAPDAPPAVVVGTSVAATVASAPVASVPVAGAAVVGAAVVAGATGVVSSLAPVVESENTASSSFPQAARNGA